ncbi:wall-associated receptor kinase 2-like [Argentina anserina]|uniref:wall-associated receptor kinase 2-like n=1 Tax=Argentina anserina TaxID=57926 RepID=UPI00217669A5|nr:wall-associated receptor kinase 2-like [Potentilla anserina]
MALQFLLVVVLLLLSGASTTKTTAAAAQALPGCSDKCGDLTVPYPFGMEERCHMEGRSEYFINCTHTTDPPTAYLMRGNLVVTNISLEVGELRIVNYVSTDCYAEGSQTVYFPTWLNLPRQYPYTVSDSKNKFYAVGCDTYAIVRGFRGGEELITGCMSICSSLASIDKNLCTGIGCCQINIPSGLNNVSVEVNSYYNHTKVWDFNPCSYAFLEEEGQFNLSTSSFQQLNSTVRLPIVLNWAIGNEEDPCNEAQKREDYACKGNSSCYNRSIKGSVGYLCECLPGYEGNPYHPNGCTDVDECTNSTICDHSSTCENLVGNYTCKCPEGQTNYGNINIPCVNINGKSKNTALHISLGVCLSIVMVLVVSFWMYCGMKRRKFNQLKEKYFKENGGLLLQQKLKNFDGPQAAKIFTKEELKNATNNFADSGKIGEGGYGTVYKGTLPDKKEVAIKVSKSNAPITQSNQFVNEVIVLSQINHRNVVRLLGCCLETQTPLLVYEFVGNGTLYEHIHIKNGKGPLSFGLRMKIATETAGSLAYLHYSTSMQIVHRDVKATNILLDENFTAKVSDFGASKLVPEDHNQLSTLVQGTLGYLDPEYLQSNTLTEKSDVYSFGVVLVELITSQVAISHEKPEAERNLANCFITSVEENRLAQIIDHEIIKDGSYEIAEQVAYLAKRCLSLKGRDRPTMKEVAMELEAILQVMAKHSGGKPDASPIESDYLHATSPANDYIVDVRGDEGEAITSIDYDQSMQNQAQIMKPDDDGR